MSNLIKDYTAYNVWASNLVFSFADQVSDHDVEVKSSFTSIRKTIFHIWDAEMIWLNRLQGISPVEWPSQHLHDNRSEDYRAEVLQTSEKFRDFIWSRSPDWFEAPCSFNDMKGNNFMMRNGEIVVHCMNHSTFHRGQLITIYRNLGVTQLRSSDYITYLRKKGNSRSELSAIYGG